MTTVKEDGFKRGFPCSLGGLVQAKCYYKNKNIRSFSYLCGPIEFNKMISKEDYAFCLDLKVRDYECDMQGIVNNSVYQNYMEHTRHEFIQTMGLNFAELCAQDIIVVVARIEIAFKHSLRSNDLFSSCVKVRKEGLKYVFDQAIFNKTTGELVVTAKVTSVARIGGKLRPSALIDAALEKYENALNNKV